MSEPNKHDGYSFGKSLLRLLEVRGMSQADLARISGIRSGLISKYISDQSNPTLPNLIVIGRALNADMNELLGIKTNMNILEGQAIRLFRGLDANGQTKAVEFLQLLYKSGDYARTKSEDHRVQAQKSA